MSKLKALAQILGGAVKRVSSKPKKRKTVSPRATRNVMPTRRKSYSKSRHQQIRNDGRSKAEKITEKGLLTAGGGIVAYEAGKKIHKRITKK